MGIDHRRLKASVSKQVLDNAYIVVCLQEVSGKGVAKGVCGDPLGYLRAAHGVVEGVLEFGFVQMVAPLLSGRRQHSECLLRKEPLVDELLGRVGVFFLDRIIKENPIISCGQILIVKLPNGLNLSLQLWEDRYRKGHCPILLPLAVNREQVDVKIEIPHSQLQALEQSQTASEQQAYEEPVGVWQFVQDGVDLLTREHHRHIQRLLRPRHISQITEIFLQHMAIKKEERVERLVLGRSCDMTFHGQES